jgi:hypothetical protein
MIPLAAFEEIIDASGTAPRIEAMLPIGVRARQLLVRTLLLGMMLVLADHRPAHLTRVHQALTALSEDDQRRLGVIADWKNAPHQLTCRQTEYTLGLVADTLAGDEPSGLPPGRLQRICDDLLEASVPEKFKDASASLAVDWTDMESFSRPPPAKGGLEPELEVLRKDTVRALEIADEQAEIRAMSRGELEVQVLEGDRAQATAPQDTSSQLRLTAQAEADAWQQAADAEAEHDAAQADNARSLATAMTAETSRLEAANARYEEWSARTASTREIAGKAKAELQRRDQQPLAGAAPGPQSMATWWREFQADAGAVDRAIEREHLAAVYDGQPWPPERKPEAAYAGPPAVAGGSEPELEQSRPGTAGVQTDPEPDASEPEISAPGATGPGLADDGHAARLGDLQARADQAARRNDAQRAELDASSEHSARIEREAQPEPAAGRQAETPYDMEMEL